MLSFNYAKLNQEQFEQLDQLLSYCKILYANSKVDVGKLEAELKLALEATAVSHVWYWKK